MPLSGGNGSGGGFAGDGADSADGAAFGTVEWAASYPFGIPDHSFVLRDGQALPWAANGADTDGRIPVIGCGSNRSPQQLARKFGTGGDGEIPVQRARLDDFDVVYAAHITRYGSIAATLQHVPGAQVEVAITWLTETQLVRMHVTEGRGADYDYARLDGIALALEHGGRREWAFAYVYREGCLTEAGAEVALSEIRADNRPHPAITQPEAQMLVHGRVDAEVPHHDFIRQNIADRELRRARERQLHADAAPFRWPDLSVIET